MHKQWIGCLADNFKTGRNGFNPEAIVIHRSGGSLADLDARFQQPQAFVSAHYAIGAAGEVHQYVEEKDTAFHAGMAVNPTWRLFKPAKNPNFYTLSVELAGSPGDPVADAQYTAAAELILDIAQAWQIAADADHVVLHSEIRAGRACPGDGFDRDRLLGLVRAPIAPPPASASDEREVAVLVNANVRERQPSTNARIVRVITAGASETVDGFTDRGERVQGNAYWYRTRDGNYFWAGATDAPQPVAAEEKPAPPVSVAPPAACAECGIARIDVLFAGSPAAALAGQETDRRAVGAIQDLLTGQGFAGLPSIVSSSYGVFGAKTADALRAFQSKASLASTGEVDGDTLRKLVALPACDPRASQAYVSLALGFPATGIVRVLALVSQMEGAGKFAALNRNTDRAGLSFGLIQWAQKPGRLTEILLAMSQADREAFVKLFGDGDERVADALVAHTRRPSGGVDSRTGVTVDAAFNLVDDPWLGRFRAASLVLRFQQVQVETAQAAFEASFRKLRAYAPDIVSERGVGFMLDVANQFGDFGAQKLYTACRKPGLAEQDLLEEIAETTVARMDDNLKAGVRARRERFLETPFLSADPFTAAALAKTTDT